VTKEEAWNLANHWVAAWNAHDLDLIMTHYEDAIELTSPVAAQLLGTPDGRVVGKSALRAYFQRGLEAYPELRFHLEDVLWGMNSLVLLYKITKGPARQSSWNSERTERWYGSWPITVLVIRDTPVG
jgi:ketosteroid isomerase-like protein